MTLRHTSSEVLNEYTRLLSERQAHVKLPLVPEVDQEFSSKGEVSDDETADSTVSTNVENLPLEERVSLERERLKKEGRLRSKRDVSSSSAFVLDTISALAAQKTTTTQPFKLIDMDKTPSANVSPRGRGTESPSSRSSPVIATRFLSDRASRTSEPTTEGAASRRTSIASKLPAERAAETGSDLGALTDKKQAATRRPSEQSGSAAMRTSLHRPLHQYYGQQPAKSGAVGDELDLDSVHSRISPFQRPTEMGMHRTRETRARLLAGQSPFRTKVTEQTLRARLIAEGINPTFGRVLPAKPVLRERDAGNKHYFSVRNPPTPRRQVDIALPLPRSPPRNHPDIDPCHRKIGISAGMGPRLSKEALRKRLTELLGPFDLPEKHMPRANEAALWGRHEQPAALVGDRAHQLIAALRDEGRDCAKDEDPRPKRLLEGLLLLQDYQKRGRARQGSSDDENVSVSDTSDSECSKDKSSSSTAAVPAGSRRRQQPRRKRKKLDEKKSRTTAPPSAHEKKTRTTALQTAREKPGSRRRKHAEAVNETSSQSSYDSDATLSASSCSSDSGHERAAGHRDRSGASEARRRKSRAKDRQEEELEDRVKSLAFDHLVSAQAPLPRGGVGQQHLQFITAEVNQHQAVMMQQHEKLLTEFRHLFREEREHSEMQHKQEAHRLAGLRAAAAETNHSVLAAKLQALEKEHEAQRERTAAIQAETAAALSRVERGLASDADKAAVARQAHGAAAAAAADEDGGVRANQRAGSPQGGAPEHATAPPQDGPPPQQREQHQPQQQQQQHHQEQQQQPPPRAAPPVAAAAAAPAAAAAAAAERPPPARGPGKKKDRSRTPPPPARDPVHATTNVSVEIRQPPPGTAQERAADPPAASEAPAKKKKKKGLFTKLFSCAGSSSEKPEGSEAGGDKKEKPPKKAGRKADDETSDSDEEDEPKAKTATEKPRKRWRLPFGRRGAGKDKAKHQLDPVSLEGKYIVKLSEETCVACINAIVASLTSNIGEGETWCYKFLGLDGIGVSSSDKRDVVQGICESDPVSINNERGNEQYAAALMALCKYFNEGRGLVPYRSTQDLLVKKGKVTCEDLQKQLSEMNVAALNLVLQHYHDAVRRVPMGTKERIAGHFAAVAFYGMAESGVDESKTKVLSQWIGDTQPSPVTITIPSPRPPVEADEQGTAQPTGADSSTGDETTAPTQSPLAAPSESPRIAPSVTVTTRIGNDSESSDDAPAERFVPSGMEGYTLKAKGKAS